MTDDTPIFEQFDIVPVSDETPIEEFPTILPVGELPKKPSTLGEIYASVPTRKVVKAALAASLADRQMVDRARARQARRLAQREEARQEREARFRSAPGSQAKHRARRQAAQ